jgi:SAM-dependent methyltransferase
MSERPGAWAERASALYNEEYARRYRAHDDELWAGAPARMLTDFLARACAAVHPPFDALDLGCGTGRFFWAVPGARSLVGLDASRAMLEQARHPYRADAIAAPVTLVHGDLLAHDFEPSRFDLVYSIGVLAEHSPLDERIVANVARWLRPGGVFAFTTVHPESASVPRTLRRQVGKLLLPISVPPMRRRLRNRLNAGGLYADERRIHDLLTPALAIESLERGQSEAHLHCLCIARKP